MWVYYVNVFHFFLVIFHLSFLKIFPDFYHRFLNPRFFSQIFPPIFLIPPLYQYNFDSFVYFDTFLRFIDSICNGYVYVKFMCAIVDLEGKVQLILGTKLFRIFHSPQFFQFLKFFLIEIIFFSDFCVFWPKHPPAKFTYMGPRYIWLWSWNRTKALCIISIYTNFELFFLL